MGVTILQAWNYALTNNDGWGMRTLVLLLVTLDIATTSNNVLLVHTYLIQNFGDIFELATVNAGFTIELGLTVIVVYMVQLFFATRVYLLDRAKLLLAGAIAGISTLGLVSSLYTVSVTAQHKDFADFTITPIRASAILGHGLVTIADTITTIVLSMNFMRARSESGISQTINILERLLAAIVARGALVTIVNGLLMILYILYPVKLYWIAIQLSQAKLYIITLIAMLNARTSYNLPTTVINESVMSSLSQDGARAAVATGRRRDPRSRMSLDLKFAAPTASYGAHDIESLP
ncbi:hypothetical protein D9613_009542 [Agrocybe pediades]|uniref:DUF6534 domain-containing protein n=1 Tax=Agrocybe pediades TaxID=84607 RepID=A0A8H4R266_9AGAR|nr:hypothetical protein D9613_009542 [Agrocybe pediades]